MSSKKALIVGATGLVGKALVRLLLEKEYYDEIIILSRRDLAIKDNRLKIVLVEDFDKLADYKDQMDAQDIYCTIGTTRKKAGSKEAFLKIDVEYPIEIARLTMNQPSFQQFLVVTSVGANPDSPLFYNEAKGKVEAALIDLDMRALKIFQPSLLIGYRDDFRLIEELAKFLSMILSFFIVGSKKTLWSIRGDEVANAMYQVAKRNKKGMKRFKPHKMLKMIYS